MSCIAETKEVELLPSSIEDSELTDIFNDWGIPVELPSSIEDSELLLRQEASETFLRLPSSIEDSELSYPIAVPLAPGGYHRP